MKLNNSIEDFNAELEALPNLQDYISNLDNLVRLCKSEITLSDVNRLYYDNAIIFPHAALRLESKEINLFNAYRVRLNINENTEDLNLIRTYSYPPPNLCKENGRANLKNKTVFYSADSAKTAIAEVKPKTGDIAYLSIWKIYCDRDIHIVPFLSDKTSTMNRISKLASAMRFNVAEKMNTYRKDKVEHLNHIYSFLADLFINEAPPYTLPSFISDSMLYRYFGIDGIIYPSYMMGTRACNFIFHPNFVDQYFRLDRIIKFRINRVDENELSYSLLSTGKVVLTNISWNSPTEEDLNEIGYQSKKINPSSVK